MIFSYKLSRLVKFSKSVVMIAVIELLRSTLYEVISFEFKTSHMHPQLFSSCECLLTVLQQFVGWKQVAEER